MADLKALLRVRITSIKSTLERQERHGKKEQASIHIANNFNSIISDISSEFPDLASSLPSPIYSNFPFSDLGLSDATYLDLEIYCEQVLSLLDLLE